MVQDFSQEPGSRRAPMYGRIRLGQNCFAAFSVLGGVQSLMRKLTQWTLYLVMLLTCAPLYAVTATDFYVGLLRRGVADVEAGRDELAVTPLRLAAFGLVDSIDHYETAQAYLVVALERMNKSEAARDAALRIVAAERVERRFAALALPAAIRASFATSARKLLPSAEAAQLLTMPSATRTPPPQMSAKPATPRVETQVETAKKPAAEPPKKTAEAPSHPPNRQVEETPAPATTAASSPSASTRRVEEAKTPPKPAPPAAKPVQVQTTHTAQQPAKPAVDSAARLAAGERALVGANLPEARKIYRELLEGGPLDRPTWIRIAEGLYRSRDFSGALTVFQRIGALRPGEEAYRYYVAVALYETGQHDAAKRELAAALPFIEVTPDVQRYRDKIDAGRH